MSLKEYGIAKYGRLLEQNVARGHYLAAQVDAQPELERLAPTPLNIVHIRYRSRGLGEEQLNRLNEELLLRLLERGMAVPRARSWTAVLP
jgi:aromatic-L-amino-acid/L-tryptophan decarboxylase